MPQSSSERGVTHFAFRETARSLFISCDTIDTFLTTATPGQLSACTSMLEGELAHRERAKRERLLRQARFPVSKSADGFDWTNVSFLDGWGRKDMLLLGFVGAAQDLVLLRADGQGQDPHGHSGRHDGRGLARLRARPRQARGHARQGLRRHLKGAPAHTRRVRIRPVRRRWSKAALPGHIGKLREEKHHLHDKHRVLEIRHALR